MKNQQSVYFPKMKSGDQFYFDDNKIEIYRFLKAGETCFFAKAPDGSTVRVSDIRILTSKRPKLEFVYLVARRGINDYAPYVFLFGAHKINKIDEK